MAIVIPSKNIFNAKNDKQNDNKIDAVEYNIKTYTDLNGVKFSLNMQVNNINLETGTITSGDPPSGMRETRWGGIQVSNGLALNHATYYYYTTDKVDMVHDGPWKMKASFIRLNNDNSFLSSEEFEYSFVAEQVDDVSQARITVETLPTISNNKPSYVAKVYYAWNLDGTATFCFCIVRNFTEYGNNYTTYLKDLSLEFNYRKVVEDTITTKLGTGENTIGYQNEAFVSGMTYSSYNYYDKMSSMIINNYKNGKETAMLTCSISEYYNENNELKISTKNNDLPMTFSIGDIVKPKIYTSYGEDVDMSIGKEFRVIQVEPYYDGAVWQKIHLIET